MNSPRFTLVSRRWKECRVIILTLSDEDHRRRQEILVVQDSDSDPDSAWVPGTVFTIGKTGRTDSDLTTPEEWL